MTLTKAARAVGVSPRTLARWVRLGLVEPPTVGTHSSGRGRTGRWTDEAVTQARIAKAHRPRRTR